MAHYITATYIVPVLRFPIRDVKISTPHARPVGLFPSAVVPAVCVVLYRDNPLGQIFRDRRFMSCSSVDAVRPA
jgi:hypothetical protein